MQRAEFGKEPEDEEQAKPAPAAGAAAGPAAQSTPQLETIANHTVSPDDTLSGIALKYYGSAIREKWMAIYEANKEVIGDNPALLRPGTVLRIPKEKA
jgi:nucleoid-associated protein YgaU